MVSEANHDKNSDDCLMKHQSNPSCRKRVLAANIDRPVALLEDDAVGVRKLTSTYASCTKGGASVMYKIT
ncbi:MAG: hypothetical protein LBU46_01960, partial [Candidatus Accumulibacter sp.]|nr:hypothetical protein [Accumulibacter sp.]